MNKSAVKIIFFGTSEFAVPALEALVKEGYKITTVITNPDEPVGRKKVLTPPPVKIAAQKLNLKVYQPPKLEIGNPAPETSFRCGTGPAPSCALVLGWKLEIPDADIGVIAAYGKIIPAEIINLPRHGILNIHPSLLPKYRGPTPIQSAILNGEKETGVTIIKIDEEVDHGPIIANEKLKMQSEKFIDLQEKLANLGANLLIKILPDYLAGKIKLQLQNHLQATFTRKFTTEDGEIKPDDTAEAAHNKIRALNPEPGTYIWLNQINKKIRLKVLEVEPLSKLNLEVQPLSRGLFIKEGHLVLKLKGGYIPLKTVQPEGKKPMRGEDFARGNRGLIGAILK